MKRRFLPIVVSAAMFVWFAALAVAAQQSMKNDDVLTLMKAGISPSLIIGKIQGSTTDFELSTDSLINLKQAGVPDEVLGAMLEANNRKAIGPTSVANAKGNSTTNSDGLIPSQASGKPVLNSWRELEIDVATPEQVIAKLGVPVQDKRQQKFQPLGSNGSSLSKLYGNTPERDFRRLQYKDIEGFDRVDLFFRNGRLVVIEFDLKKDLTAAAMTGAYQSRFVPLVGNYIGISPDDLADQTRDIQYPSGFPSEYLLGAANKSVLAIAFASIGKVEDLQNTFMQSLLRRPRNEYVLSPILPGLVRRLQLISRTLELRNGPKLFK